ncbi:MAG TPA: hypothetical protein DD789_06660 [Firmicutes bacterium]|jgi:hypothetical protein|nr:hypothetical protein [Bacillota bacterium]
MPKELAGREIGYYSLTLCLVKNMTLDEAFQIIAPDPNTSRQDLFMAQTKEMYAMWKIGMTLTEIGEIFHTKSWEVGRRIDQHEKELKQGRLARRAAHGYKMSS